MFAYIASAQFLLFSISPQNMFLFNASPQMYYNFWVQAFISVFSESSAICFLEILSWVSKWGYQRDLKLISTWTERCWTRGKSGKILRVGLIGHVEGPKDRSGLQSLPQISNLEAPRSFALKIRWMLFTRLLMSSRQHCSVPIFKACGSCFSIDLHRNGGKLCTNKSVMVDFGACSCWYPWGHLFLCYSFSGVVCGC